MASASALLGTSSGLAALPTRSLLRAAVVFHACGSETLVKAGSAALSHAVSLSSSAPPTAAALLARPMLAAARVSIFRQFVAGEELDDVRSISSALSECNVRCIVDHSTEELEDEGARRHNLDNKLRLLQTLSAELGSACSFVPIKLTGLVSPTLLERLTDGVHAAGAGKHLDKDDDGSNGAATTVETLAEAAKWARLGESERTELEDAMALLRELCEGARSTSIPLLFDAEQTHRQPAIRLIARELSAQFNRGRAGERTVGQPLVYDTHQAYLRGTEARIAADLAHARAHGYTLAVKLVRGAYRGGEAQRDPRVLQPTKAHSDAAYDTCARLLLDAAVEDGDDRSRPAAALLVATHNRASALAVAEALTQRRPDQPSHPRVHFAQILGMADDLTLSLGLGGYNAHKLVPYGAFEEVLPWLLRRLEENQDALGAAATERPLLRQELARRLRWPSS